jgi:hypothetical protein
LAFIEPFRLFGLGIASWVFVLLPAEIAKPQAPSFSCRICAFLYAWT